MIKAKQYREAYGITIDEMARAIGVSVPTLRLKEIGEREFTRTEMAALTAYITEKAKQYPISLENIFYSQE